MSAQLGKKILSVTLATSTTVWLSGVSLVAPLLVSAGHGGLVDSDLMRASGDAKIYVVKLVAGKHFKRWIQTPEIFNSYLHLKWENVKSVSASDADAYTESVLVRALADTKVYHVDKTKLEKHWVASPAAMTANNWDWDSIYTINTRELSLYPEGAAITGVIAMASPSPSPAPSPALVGSVLQVGAPTTQVAAATFVSGNSASAGAQSLADFMKIRFTAGTDGDVKVKKLVLTRGGISSDSDVSDMYLYDGMTRVAETPAVSTGKFTFSNSAGLFTVSKGSSKEITIKLDLTSNTAGGKTINFSVVAAGDVETDGATVQGTLPLASNNHSTANVTDLGRILFQNSSPTANTTVDPQNDLEIWRFTAQATNQDIEVRRMRVTIVGTIVAADLTNLKLMEGGTQIGSTVANLDANKVADFDLSASPLKTKSGVTKTLTLRADVVGGTNRTFRPSVQKRSDVEVYDAGYKVFLRPMTASASDTFSIMQPNSSADFSGTNRDFTINAGTLTVTVATDSPSGNVAVSGTNVVLARYDFKAAGENVKVTDLAVCVDWSASNTATHGFRNGQLFVNDGSGTAYAQVGTTDSNLTVDDTASANCDDSDDFNAFSLGNQFVINGGKTRQLEVRADMTTTGSGAPASAAGQTIVIALNAGNSSTAANAQGLVSLTSITAPSADLSARTVTLASGAISVASNSGLANYTAQNPLIIGQSNGKIASFVVTAGAGEAVDVTSIVLTANTTNGKEWGRNLTNLKVCKVGTACSGAGNQIGTTATSLSTTDENETKTFTVSPAIRVAAGGQQIFDVHADVLSSASDTNESLVGVRVGASGATATGVNTGTSSSAPSAALNLQNIFIASAGTITISASPSSELPVAQIYKMSTGTSVNEVVLGKFRIDAQFEDFNIDRIIVNDTFSAGVTSTRASSTLRSFRLYVGSVSSANKLAGPISLSPTSTPVNGGDVDFNGGFTAVSSENVTVVGGGTSFVVPKNTIKTVVVTAEVNETLQASSGQTHQLSLDDNPERVSTAVTGRGAVSSASIAALSAITTIGNTYEIRRNYPVVLDDTTGTNIADGSVNDFLLAKFRIKVPAGDESVRIKKIALEVTLNDAATTTNLLSLSNWRLFRNGTELGGTEYKFFNGAVATTSANAALGGAGVIANASNITNATNGLRPLPAGESTATAPNSTTTTVVLAFAPEEIVSAGATPSYDVKVNIANTANNDSISVRILGDSSSLSGDRTGDAAVVQAAGAIFNVDSTAASFIWSDVWNGVSNHGTVSSVTGTVTTGNDWTNGTLVPASDPVSSFLPTSAKTHTNPS